MAKEQKTCKNRGKQSQKSKKNLDDTKCQKRMTDALRKLREKSKQGKFQIPIKQTAERKRQRMQYAKQG